MRTFPVGDVLELVALICLGAFLWIEVGWPWALLVAAVGSFYLAQTTPGPRDP